MSTTARMIIVLAVITTISGGILASWDSFTQPKIEQHRLEKIRSAVADVLPPHDHYEEMQEDGKTFYVGKDASGNTVGIAFRAAGSGFQGEIAMMVGVAPDFAEITGVAILEQIETPGLGSKIDRDPGNRQNPDWFTEQFQGVPTSPDITALKNEKPDQPTEVQAITGATISSRAVVYILNRSLEQAKAIYQTRIQQAG